MRSAIKYLAAAALVAVWLTATPAQASQGSCVMPTSGTVSGLTLVQDLNACSLATQSANSGATAPTNIGPSAGMLWYDTSTGYVRVYDGASWLPVGRIDTSGHLWNPPIGGGTGSVASATTTDLCSVPQSALTIGGVTTITGFSNTCQAGQIKALTFSGVLTLTYNATSMILPNNGSNITTAAGDAAWAVYLGSGNWKVLAYVRADGTAINASAVFTGAVFYDSPISTTVSGNTNNLNPAGLSTANVLRVTCSATANITGLTAPATDGKIVVVDSDAGSTNTCTLTTQDAASTATNRFAFDRPIALRPGRSLTLKYDSNAARWRLAQEITTQPIAGGFKNLRVFNIANALGDSAPASPNVQMIIAADEITLEDSSGGATRLSSVSCTVDISGNSFSAGNGGLDTGTATVSNWYSLWTIFNPTSNVTSCLASLSATAPTMPSGYTYKARVGWDYYLTNNAVTGFQRIIQYGRTARYIPTTSTPTPVPPLVVSAAQVSYTAASLATLTPPTAVKVCVAANNSVNTSNWGVAPNAAYANPPSASANNNPPLAWNGASIPYMPSGCFALQTQNIFYFSNTGTLIVSLYEWEDNL